MQPQIMILIECLAVTKTLVDNFFVRLLFHRHYSYLQYYKINFGYTMNTVSIFIVLTHFGNHTSLEVF